MKNTAKTALFLGILSALLLIVGQAVAGQQGLIIAFIFAALFNLGSYWFSDRMVLAMYRAKEVGPEHPLSRIVQRLTQGAGLPMPRVYVIPTNALNAFATGRNPEHAAVAATDGILRALSERELEGVMAHELTHVKHRDTLIGAVAATIAAAIMMLASMARWGAILGGFGGRDNDRGGGNLFTLLAMALVAPIAAGLIQAAISRSREFEADRGGAEMVGSPSGLADALRKLDVASKQLPMPANPATAHLFIVKPFSGQALANLFSTHPSTEERVARLLGR